MNRPNLLLARVLLALAFLALAATASAQSLPTRIEIAGNTATVEIGAGLADLTLTFDEASGLTPSALGVSAELVDPTDPALLARLADAALTPIEGAFPLLITVEPPATGGLSFQRTVRVEVHTHALPYTAGSSLRLFKAPLDGPFRDITDEIAPGSVRARGTTGGFSQFLVLTDLRSTGAVIEQKFDWLDGQLAQVAESERTPLAALLADARTAVAEGRYGEAIAALDSFRGEVIARAGHGIPQEWRATRDTHNAAGELLAGAATLKYSVAYLRDFGD